MKNFFKISVTTLGTLALLGTSVLAATGTVAAESGLVLRKSASKSGEPMMTVPNNTEVDILEESGEWYKIKYNEQEGYIYAQFVKVKEEEVKPSENENQNQNENQNNQALKVYEIPLITSTVINEIPANTQITVQKKIKNWSYVVAGDIQGWVRSYGLKHDTAEQVQEQNVENTETNVTETTTQVEEQATEVTEQTETESTETQENNQTSTTETSSEETTQTTTSGKGVINVEYANVRKEASTDSDVVTTLTKNTSITIKAEVPDWYQIEYKGADGVVYSGFISKKLITIQ